MRLIIILTALMVWVSIGVRPLASDWVYSQYMRSGYVNIDDLKSSISINSGDTLKLSELVKKYIRLKDYPSAYAVLIEILNHNNGDVVPWAIWAMRAVCEVSMGQIQAAEKSIIRSLEYNPEFDGAKMLKISLDKAKKTK